MRLQKVFDWGRLHRRCQGGLCTSVQAYEVLTVLALAGLVPADLVPKFSELERRLKQWRLPENEAPFTEAVSLSVSL